MIDHELTKVKIIKFEENRGEVNEYRAEKLLDDKVQLTNKLNDLKLEKKFIVEAVNSLEGIEREIIIEFFFERNSISKISKNKCYCESYIRKLKSNAIDRIDNILYK